MRTHILFAVLGVLLLLQSAQGAWWNASWEMKRPVNVSVEGDRPDYQLFVSFARPAEARNDCGDVRFVNASESGELDHWLQGSGSTCSFWVKGNWTNANGTQLYVYYNNSGATSVSNISRAFVFGDDFEQNTTSQYSCSKWQGGSWGWNATSKRFRLSGNNMVACSPTTQDTGITGYVVSADLRFEMQNGYYGGVCGYQSSAADYASGYCALLQDNNSGSGIYDELNIFEGSSGHKVGVDVDVSTGIDYSLSATFTSGSIAGNVSSPVTAGTNYSDSSYASGYYGVLLYNEEMEVDNLRVRKFATPEPMVALGAEVRRPSLVYPGGSTAGAADAGQNPQAFRFMPQSGQWANCSLLTNESGSLAVAATNSSPVVNGDINTIYHSFTDDSDYSWAVRCYEASGTSGETGGKLTVDLPPSAPVFLNSSAMNETQAQLSWGFAHANGASRYEVFVDGSNVASLSGASYLLSGLLPGRDYNVSVAAYDGSGLSSRGEWTLKTYFTNSSPTNCRQNTTMQPYLTTDDGWLFLSCDWQLTNPNAVALTAQKDFALGGANTSFGGAATRFNATLAGGGTMVASPLVAVELRTSVSKAIGRVSLFDGENNDRIDINKSIDSDVMVAFSYRRGAGWQSNMRLYRCNDSVCDYINSRWERVSYESNGTHVLRGPYDIMDGISYVVSYSPVATVTNDGGNQPGLGGGLPTTPPAPTPNATNTTPSAPEAPAAPAPFLRVTSPADGEEAGSVVEVVAESSEAACLASLDGESGAMTGNGTFRRVFSGLEPGSHTLEVTCGNLSELVTFAVINESSGEPFTPTLPPVAGSVDGAGGSTTVTGAAFDLAPPLVAGFSAAALAAVFFGVRRRAPRRRSCDIREYSGDPDAPGPDLFAELQQPRQEIQGAGPAAGGARCAKRPFRDYFDASFDRPELGQFFEQAEKMQEKPGEEEKPEAEPDFKRVIEEYERYEDDHFCN